MDGLLTPLEQPETYCRRNLATGPLAEATLRAWAGLQAARGYRATGDMVGLQLTVAVMSARAIRWPPRVRTYATRALNELLISPNTGLIRP